MSHSLHIILRCNGYWPPPQDGARPVPCDQYFIAAARWDIEQARQAANAKGWKFKPGKPYRHINGTDLCHRHAKGT